MMEVTPEQYHEILCLLDKARATLRKYRRNKNKLTLDQKLALILTAAAYRKQAREIGNEHTEQ